MGLADGASAGLLGFTSVALGIAGLALGLSVVCVPASVLTLGLGSVLGSAVTDGLPLGGSFCVSLAFDY